MIGFAGIGAELVLVDDNSSDFTEALLDAHTTANRWEKLTIIRNKRRLGLARSRNIALAAATSDTVFFGDDDCYFPSDGLIVSAKCFTKIRRDDEKAIALTLPIYVRSTEPRKVVDRSEIGCLDSASMTMWANFDCIPTELSFLKKPFRTSRVSGVCYCSRKLLMRVGGFPSDGTWKNDYHEHHDLSFRIAKAKLHIYHVADPRQAVYHFKFGARGAYRPFSSEEMQSRELPLQGCSVAFHEMVKWSRATRFNTGCRLSSREFAATEIGSLFGVLLSYNPRWAFKWARDTYKSFVLRGYSFSSVIGRSKLARDEREAAWKRAILKGVTYARNAGAGKVSRELIRRLLREVSSIERVL